MGVDIIQFIPGLNRAKAKEGGAHHSLASLLSWDISSHLISCPQIGIYIISSLGSQAVTLRLNCTPSFAGSPACKQHIMGLFSLRYCTSQPLILNFLLCHIHSVFFWRTLTNTVLFLDNFETHFIRPPEGLTRVDMSLVAVANSVTYISFLSYPISSPPLLDSLPKSSTYIQGSDSGSALRRIQPNTGRKP